MQRFIFELSYASQGNLYHVFTQPLHHAQSAGAVEYTDCFSAEG